MSDIRLDRNKVYRVISAQDDTVFLAIEPVFQDGHMCWFDTIRPRMIAGRMVSHSTRSAHFRSAEGADYRFQMLTLETYNAEVRSKVEGGPAFPNEAELHRFYTENF